MRKLLLASLFTMICSSLGAMENNGKNPVYSDDEAEKITLTHQKTIPHHAYQKTMPYYAHCSFFELQDLKPTAMPSGASEEAYQPTTQPILDNQNINNASSPSNVQLNTGVLQGLFEGLSKALVEAQVSNPKVTSFMAALENHLKNAKPSDTSHVITVHYEKPISTVSQHIESLPKKRRGRRKNYSHQEESSSQQQSKEDVVHAHYASSMPVQKSNQTSCETLSNRETSQTSITTDYSHSAQPSSHIDKPQSVSCEEKCQTPSEEVSNTDTSCISSSEEQYRNSKCTEEQKQAAITTALSLLKDFHATLKTYSQYKKDKHLEHAQDLLKRLRRFGAQDESLKQKIENARNKFQEIFNRKNSAEESTLTESDAGRIILDPFDQSKNIPLDIQPLFKTIKNELAHNPYNSCDTKQIYAFANTFRTRIGLYYRVFYIVTPRFIGIFNIEKRDLPSYANLSEKYGSRVDWYNRIAAMNTQQLEKEITREQKLGRTKYVETLKALLKTMQQK